MEAIYDLRTKTIDPFSKEKVLAGDDIAMTIDETPGKVINLGVLPVRRIRCRGCRCTCPYLTIGHGQTPGLADEHRFACQYRRSTCNARMVKPGNPERSSTPTVGHTVPSGSPLVAQAKSTQASEPDRHEGGRAERREGRDYPRGERPPLQ